MSAKVCCVGHEVIKNTAMGNEFLVCKGCGNEVLPEKHPNPWGEYAPVGYLDPTDFDVWVNETKAVMEQQHELMVKALIDRCCPDLLDDEQEDFGFTDDSDGDEDGDVL